MLGQVMPHMDLDADNKRKLLEDFSFFCPPAREKQWVSAGHAQCSQHNGTERALFPGAQQHVSSNRTDFSQIATNLAATCNYAALSSGAQQQQHRTTNAQARNNVELRKIRAQLSVATIRAATCNYAALFYRAQQQHKTTNAHATQARNKKLRLDLRADPRDG